MTALSLRSGGRIRLIAALAAFSAIAGFLLPGPRPLVHAHASSLSISVSGKNLIDQNGNVVRLVGFNMGSTMNYCAHGNGIIDGPTDAATLSNMLAWNINAVRISLNEDCWLGINGVPATMGGAAYQAAIVSYVQTMESLGLFVILDLHYVAPGSNLSWDLLEPMADMDHAPAFWTSVAQTFINDHAVMFDLYNEPNNITWSCWKTGGAACPASYGYTVAGMQTLVNTVRATGATQPVLLSGISWGNDLSQFPAYKPTDPLFQMVAVNHFYNYMTPCYFLYCWQNTYGLIATHIPVISDEIGENDCTGSYMSQYMPWADGAGVSYLSWAWVIGSCTAGPSLITDYSPGDPTNSYGAWIQGHYKALGASVVHEPPQVATVPSA
jgi:endoglucanase